MKKILFLSILGILVMSGCSNSLGGASDTVIKKTTVLDAVTSTTTSSAIDIEGAKRVTLFLDQDFVGGTNLFSTTTFAVTVSIDDTTYITYNKLIDNLTNSNSQNLTRVASKVVDDATDYILSMDLENDLFSSFKVSATTAMAEGTKLASTTVTVKALIEL